MDMNNKTPLKKTEKPNKTVNISNISTTLQPLPSQKLKETLPFLYLNATFNVHTHKKAGQCPALLFDDLKQFA